MEAFLRDRQKQLDGTSNIGSFLETVLPQRKVILQRREGSIVELVMSEIASVESDRVV
jgi:hypothetical protein